MSGGQDGGEGEPGGIDEDPQRADRQLQGAVAAFSFGVSARFVRETWMGLWDEEGF